MGTPQKGAEIIKKRSTAPGRDNRGVCATVGLC
jgi:hypothetical protein